MNARTAVFIALLSAPLPFTCAEGGPVSKFENSVTVYGGERFGGSVTDSISNSSIALDNGSSFAVAVDVGLDWTRQLEFFYSQQNTALSSGPFAAPANNVSLTLHNYQLGGTNFIDQVGRGLYVMGGLGGTTAQQTHGGGHSQTFLSANVGVGWMVPLGAHAGLRFEARGYGILLSNNSAVFCGGAAGCTAAIQGAGLFEGEVLAGLTVRF